MTDELTLREKVLEAVRDSALIADENEAAEDAMKTICTALEDTGSPAHMRVAAELRGE